MISLLKSLLTRWFGTQQPTPAVVYPTDEPAATTAPAELHPASPQLVAYDENLYDKAKTQWQFGDWHSLANMDDSSLANHPEAGKLFLLKATAQSQLGNTADAMSSLKQAQQCGIQKKLIAKLLVSGVYNTLGKTALIAGQQQRALGYFEQSLSNSGMAGDVKLLASGRITQQAKQLGQVVELSPNSDVPMTELKLIHANPLSEELTRLQQSITEHNHSLQSQLKQQQDALQHMKRNLHDSFKKETQNAIKQLESFLGIQSFLQYGERLPGMHGWPVSPDFALYLIELIDSNDYDLIIEFGSGTSSVLMAKTLARIGRKDATKPATLQVAFEHLEKYHAQTLANLHSAGLSDAVKLILTPLQPYHAPNDQVYAYYSCQEALSELAKRFANSDLKILVVVDGPPGSTGKHARYPALPHLLNVFAHQKMHLVLDDYARQEEKDVANMWESLLKQRSIHFETEQVSSEKGLYFCQVN